MSPPCLSAATPILAVPDMDDRTLARFMSKVEVQPNGCWRWRGKPNDQGYGYFWFDGKKRLAHRFAYQHFVGPIPDGYEVDHLCHTRDKTCPGGKSDPHRRCVNPADLEAVTDRVNLMRGKGPAALNAQKTECGKGHPFSEENTYLYPDGLERGCRICRAQAIVDWRAKNNPDSGPHNRDKTHCPQGHPYDNANTYLDPRGGRACRTCRKIRDRESKRRMRERAKRAQA